MCGRYRLSRRKQLIEQYFDCSGEEDWSPRYNIAPTQLVPVIRQHPQEPHRMFSLMRWGLIPSLGEGCQRLSSDDQRQIRNCGYEACLPRPTEIPQMPDSGRRLLRVVATRSCMCDCPASTTRPDLPSHWQYPTRYGDSVTTRLEALGQCIPPSQDGYRNREGTIFLPASRRIGARVSGRVSRCEPL